MKSKLPKTFLQQIFLSAIMTAAAPLTVCGAEDFFGGRIFQ